jgi:hypothetical protein
MKADDDWDTIRRARQSFSGAGTGLIRLTLLFGSAAVALALLAAPLLEKRSDQNRFTASSGPGMDYTTTGSIGNGEAFTVRRSVLQKSPDSVCVIRQDGSRSGDC